VLLTLAKSTLGALLEPFSDGFSETVWKIVRVVSGPYFWPTRGAKQASLPFLSAHEGASVGAIQNFQGNYPLIVGIASGSIPLQDVRTRCSDTLSKISTTTIQTKTPV
jgi:hypothetical protein